MKSFYYEIRFRDKNVGSVKSSIALPQGDTCSPLNFSLFLHDLPDISQDEGASLSNVKIPILLYADDMVSLSNSPEELQSMLDKLFRYLDTNGLKMNTNKTKIMPFYRGPPVETKFFMNGFQL